MHGSQHGLRPFSTSGYEIFDDDFEDTGEIVIWSRSPLAPDLGERFNIETGGDVHELVVGELRTFIGGWSATCRAEGG
jgi:hypothetical protein